MALFPARLPGPLLLQPRASALPYQHHGRGWYAPLLQPEFGSECASGPGSQGGRGPQEKAGIN